MKTTHIPVEAGSCVWCNATLRPEDSFKSGCCNECAAWFNDLLKQGITVPYPSTPRQVAVIRQLPRVSLVPVDKPVHALVS